jgi:hypothetical protein
VTGGGGLLFFNFVFAEYFATHPIHMGNEGCMRGAHSLSMFVKNLVIRYVIISCSQNPKKRNNNKKWHQTKAGNAMHAFFEKLWPPPPYNLHFATFIEK